MCEPISQYLPQRPDIFLEELFSLIMPFCLMRHNKSPLTKEIRGRLARAKTCTEAHTILHVLQSYRHYIQCCVLLKSCIVLKNFLRHKQPKTSFIQNRKCKCFEMTFIYSLYHISTIPYQIQIQIDVNPI